jgi:hypothetical protein
VQYDFWHARKKTPKVKRFPHVAIRETQESNHAQT